MIGLAVACTLLVLLSGLFYLFPRVRSGGADQDLERANLDWLRLREEELREEGAEDLAGDARLRLLEDEQVSAAVSVDADTQRRLPGWTLLLAVAVFSSLLYYRLGAAPDVLISERLQNLGDQSTAEEMAALMLAIEQRAGQRDNPHYTALLGRYYMGQQDYARAADTYDALVAVTPEDAQALAYAAQARYLAAGRTLSDAARMRAEQALAIDPHQRTALGLLGMASYEQGQYRAAIAYWQRLVAMEPPGSETARMIGGIIEQARNRLGEPAQPDQGAELADGGAVGVSVTVSLPEGASVGPGDTVFVLARSATANSRMPIAVQRLQGRELPLQLRLDDSNSMAGQKLSDAGSVVVVVQVSPDGRPGEANATWTGQTAPIVPSEALDPVEIILAPRAG